MRSSGRSRSARRAIPPIEGSLSSFQVLRNGTMTASGRPAICTFLMPASGDPCVPGTVRYRQSGWRETRSGVPCVFAACTAARNLRSSMAKARAVSPSVKADRIPIFLSLSIALSVCSQCLQNPPAAAPAAGGSSWNSRPRSAWHEFLRSFTLHFSQHLPKSPAPFRDRLAVNPLIQVLAAGPSGNTDHSAVLSSLCFRIPQQSCFSPLFNAI